MADASEATQTQPVDYEGEATFTSVKAALFAVEQGEPCLHLNLAKPSQTKRSAYDLFYVPSKMTAAELAELVDALPRLTQLKTLLLTCMARSTYVVLTVVSVVAVLQPVHRRCTLAHCALPTCLPNS